MPHRGVSQLDFSYLLYSRGVPQAPARDGLRLSKREAWPVYPAPLEIESTHKT